jgi:hypothetical protein
MNVSRCPKVQRRLILLKHSILLGAGLLTDVFNFVSGNGNTTKAGTTDILFKLSEEVNWSGNSCRNAFVLASLTFGDLRFSQ